MQDFTTSVEKLIEEAEQIQKKELILQQEAKIFNDKLMGFLKEQGLTENWTIPQLMGLAIKKSRAGLILP